MSELGGNARRSGDDQGDPRAAALASSTDLSGAGPEGSASDAPRTASLQLILLLAAVTAIGPFAMQAIAPALPTLSTSLQISASAAQSLVSMAMLGMAVGSIIYGPLADHFGRRPVLLGGLVISVCGALLACAAPSFGWVLIGRVAQAIGSGAGMVLARAAAQDLFGSRGSADVIARMTAAMVLAPMLAPAIGGVLTQYFGWRGIFAAIALLSLALLLVVYRHFAETARSFSARLDLASATRDYGAVLSRPAFRANAAFCAIQMMSFFIYVSGGPYVLERAYGVGPGIYGIMFVCAAGVYMIGNLISTRVAERLGHEGALRAGALLAAAGCGSIGLLLWAIGAGDLAPGQVHWLGGVAMSVGLCFHAVGAGVVTPLAIAGAVAAFPERAGSASSLVGVAQFSAGALAAQAAGLLPLDHGAPLLLTMGGFCLAAFLAFVALRPARLSR